MIRLKNIEVKDAFSQLLKQLTEYNIVFTDIQKLNDEYIKVNSSIKDFSLSSKYNINSLKYDVYLYIEDSRNQHYKITLEVTEDDIDNLIKFYKNISKEYIKNSKYDKSFLIYLAEKLTSIIKKPENANKIYFNDSQYNTFEQSFEEVTYITIQKSTTYIEELLELGDTVEKIKYESKLGKLYVIFNQPEEGLLYYIDIKQAIKLFKDYLDLRELNKFIKQRYALSFCLQNFLSSGIVTNKNLFLDKCRSLCNAVLYKDINLNSIPLTQLIDICEIILPDINIDIDKISEMYDINKSLIANL